MAMQRPAGELILVWATMRDGEVVTDLARDFSGFLDAVLSFRRDPDACAVRWTVAPSPATLAARLGRDERAVGRLADLVRAGGRQ